MDWHELHECSYCYFKVYVGTCNLKYKYTKKMYNKCYLGLFWLSLGSLSPTSLALSSTDLSPFPWYLDSSSYR